MAQPDFEQFRIEPVQPADPGVLNQAGNNMRRNFIEADEAAQNSNPTLVRDKVREMIEQLLVIDRMGRSTSPESLYAQRLIGRERFVRGALGELLADAKAAGDDERVMKIIRANVLFGLYYEPQIDNRPLRSKIISRLARRAPGFVSRAQHSSGYIILPELATAEVDFNHHQQEIQRKIAQAAAAAAAAAASSASTGPSTAQAGGPSNPNVNPSSSTRRRTTSQTASSPGPSNPNIAASTSASTAPAFTWGKELVWGNDPVWRTAQEEANQKWNARAVGLPTGRGRDETFERLKVTMGIYYEAIEGLRFPGGRVVARATMESLMQRTWTKPAIVIRFLEECKTEVSAITSPDLDVTQLNELTRVLLISPPIMQNQEAKKARGLTPKLTKDDRGKLKMAFRSLLLACHPDMLNVHLDVKQELAPQMEKLSGTVQELYDLIQSNLPS